MSSSTNTIINPKPCNYGCGTRIYWNTSENAYFEIFSGNRHQCPNRRYQQQQGNKSNNVIQTTANTTTKPNYYKKSYYATQQKQNQQSKPKMSNSLELLTG